MIRNTSLLMVVALMAASSAQGADFPFNARVNVLQAIDVVTTRFVGPTASTTALTVHGSQDQCLDLQWLGGDGMTLAQGALGPDQTVTGLIRLDQDGRGLLEPGSNGWPQGSTLQINLN